MLEKILLVRKMIASVHTQFAATRHVDRQCADNRGSNAHAQNGRSMLEMLGVLAVVGVLSVGGVAGYSKAMTKYRINRAVNQIVQLAQNIRMLYINQINYSTLDYEVIKKARLAPEDMYETADTNWLMHPFRGYVLIGSNDKIEFNDYKAFYIQLYDLPQEVCIELLTKDWGSGPSSGLIVVGDIESGSQMLNCTPSAKHTCATEGVMSVEKAMAICSKATNNHISWKFY